MNIKNTSKHLYFKIMIYIYYKLVFKVGSRRCIFDSHKNH